MTTAYHEGRLAEAEREVERMHRPPRQYGLLEEAACYLGRHDYDGLCRADEQGRIVRNCLRPACRKTQRLTPPVIYSS